MARPGIGYPVYQQPSRVTFGSGSAKTLADTAMADAVFFMTGQAGVRAALDAALARRGKQIDGSRVIVKPAGEPTIEMVERGAQFLADTNPVHVIAVGGGSVLDWCRLSWAASADMLAFDTGRVAADSNGHRRPDFTLVPTTCGTGAEAAGVAVYTAGPLKRAAVSRAFVADHVILDAQFLKSVDGLGLACSLADTLSHGIESFVSLVPGTLAKESGVAAVRLVLEHAGEAAGSCRDERLMEAGYLGGVAASNCSVGVVHAFAHSIAALGIGHGHGNALGLTAGVLTNADAAAMSTLVRRFGCSTPDEFAMRLRNVVAPALASPASDRFRGFLSDVTTRAEIAERMSKDVCLRSNPRPMSADDLNAFLSLVEETLDPSWSPRS